MAKLTLGNAIRAGCELVPPTIGLTFRFDATGKEWAERIAHTKPLLGADALGTALVGLVGDANKAIERAFAYENGPLGVLYELYPYLTRVRQQCPDCLKKAAWAAPVPMPLSSLLWHTQDVHGWSRERVAEFLDERKDA